MWMNPPPSTTPQKKREKKAPPHLYQDHFFLDILSCQSFRSASVLFLSSNDPNSHNNFQLLIKLTLETVMRALYLEFIWVSCVDTRLSVDDCIRTCACSARLSKDSCCCNSSSWRLWNIHTVHSERALIASTLRNIRTVVHNWVVITWDSEIPNIMRESS